MNVNFKDIMDIIYEKDNIIYLKDKEIAELEKRIDRVITYIDFVCFDMPTAVRDEILNILRGNKWIMI